MRQNKDRKVDDIITFESKSAAPKRSSRRARVTFSATCDEYFGENPPKISAKDNQNDFLRATDRSK
jgi:hypothetical protein